MLKRFRQKLNFVEPLDLHGIKHADVTELVEDYILNNQKFCPLKIITGNSDKMKKIVIEVLETHRFNFDEGDFYNRGYINVLN
tara:strand:+ start:809 stop:1057 length:249 start_codon:yes stop_codon:yes gene_type:complete